MGLATAPSTIKSLTLSALKTQYCSVKNICSDFQDSRYELNTFKRRTLSHTKAEASTSNSFYQWEPDARVEAGDKIIYIEFN
jgi:hypothetical protein